MAKVVRGGTRSISPATPPSHTCPPVPAAMPVASEAAVAAAVTDGMSSTKASLLTSGLQASPTPPALSISDAGAALGQPPAPTTGLGHAP